MASGVPVCSLGKKSCFADVTDSKNLVTWTTSAVTGACGFSLVVTVEQALKLLPFTL